MSVRKERERDGCSRREGKVKFKAKGRYKCEVTVRVSGTPGVVVASGESWVRKGERARLW